MSNLPRNARPWQIVVFGATGFVGQLIARYLWLHAPVGLRLALAGRDRDKLQMLCNALQTTHRADPPELGIILANIDDPASLRAMTAATDVLVTTVGPYARFGEPVVAACISTDTDILDLTGEPAFVATIRERYAEAAAASGALVIHCCGFDSIPTDLGVLFTVKQLPADQPITIRGYFEGNAGFSGGTFASALGAFAGPRPKSGKPRPRPATTRTVQRLRTGFHYQPELRRWAVPLPTIDPQIALASARARPDYGPEFRYGHYLCLQSLPQVGLLVAGLGVVAGLAQFAPTRALLSRLKPPGSGPDAVKRARSWFRFVFHGQAGTTTVATEVCGGDPGYDETARMSSETALCLVYERSALAYTSGIHTTAAVMGEALLARLIASGMAFRVLRRSTAP